MKPKQYILQCIIIALCLTLLYATYRPQTPCEHKSILTEIQGLKTAITALGVDRVVVDRIEELTRENEQLTTENAALKDYINGFEDKFWKGMICNEIE